MTQSNTTGRSSQSDSKSRDQQKSGCGCPTGGNKNSDNKVKASGAQGSRVGEPDSRRSGNTGK